MDCASATGAISEPENTLITRMPAGNISARSDCAKEWLAAFDVRASIERRFTQAIMGSVAEADADDACIAGTNARASPAQVSELLMRISTCEPIWSAAAWA